MTIDNNFLDQLTTLAQSNVRLRQNFDLRNSEDDNSQRMLNAIEPGSIMPIHRHPNTSTTVIIVRGMLRQNFYHDNRGLTESIILNAYGENRIV